ARRPRARGAVWADQRADVFVAAVTRQPQGAQLVIHSSGRLDCAPYPARAGVRLLDADLDHSLWIRIVERDGVEKLGPLYREEQEGQQVVRQLGERRIGEPHCVRQADGHALVGRNERMRAENRVAQSCRLRLHDVDQIGAAELPAVVFEDVRFAGADDEADLLRAAPDQTLHQVFAYRARSLDVVQHASADG